MEFTREDWERDGLQASTLTYDELATVGRIVLAWGSAEAATGDAVASLYELSGSETIRNLVLRNGFQKKIELARVALDERETHRVARLCLDELVWVWNRYKSARDTLVHGYAILDADAIVRGESWVRGIRMPAHDRFLAAADLGKQLVAAEYGAMLATVLRMGIIMNRTEKGRETLDNVPLMPERPLDI